MRLSTSQIPDSDIKNPSLHWLIDLDNTVYTPQKSLMEIIDQRIQYYISYKCRCDLAEAERIRLDIYHKHKHTFLGALKEKIILKSELPEFLDYCHNFDIKDQITPNAPILSLLKKIQGNKYVFTNTVSKFTHQILHVLKLKDTFKKIYCLENLDFNYKPGRTSFKIILRDAMIKSQNVVLIDDDQKNLDTAINLGMKAYYPTYKS